MYVKPSIDLLFDEELKKKQSRMRTKFIKRLNEHNKHIVDSRNELAKEHAEKDGEGEPIIIDENGKKRYKILDMESFDKDVSELYEESIIFDSENDEDMLKTVGEVIMKLDKAYKGAKATAYDYLYDEFEKEMNKNDD